MRVKLILAAPEAARRKFRRPVKYSLFPPLGLATLAGYLREVDEVTLCDESVERLDLSDTPDLVGLQCYVASANRAYEIADHYRRKGVHVAMGGLHVTSRPEEAAQHADTVFLGPGEDTWPVFLEDFRAGRPGRVYQSRERTLAHQPPIRRDLIKRHLYLAANSLVVSRGCPHQCDFCMNSVHFRGGKSFYTQSIDQALAEIARLPGRYLYFLDDHLLGDRAFALELFAAMRGMGKVWQAAGTVPIAFDGELLTAAAEAGLRTLLVGFETLSETNLRAAHKYQNLGGDYGSAVRRFHDAGVMVNGTFVFGLDDDDRTVFDRTVEWAIAQGMETATFHILTPYPGTGLRRRLEAEGRILSNNWDLYDTAHAVYRPAKMTPAELESGYRRAFRDFYRWSSLFRSASLKPSLRARLRHMLYAASWGKADLVWDLAALTGMVGVGSPVLSSVLAAATPRRERAHARGVARA
jgi:radical SAM superfamily enzyme YgiQ (UPF0313 family)